ncbi:MAG: protein YgfX [Gammaproteobacteria bacterium]
MSIALSVLVRPSRLLRWALAAHGAVLGALALALLSGRAGPVAWPGALAAMAGLAACALVRAALLARTAHQIDVSGLGELRVTVKHHESTAVGTASSQPVSMRLLPGSTLWPYLLVLLLARRDSQRRRGAVLALLVLPDSLPPDQFAALAVACRSIGNRSRGKRSTTARNQQFVEPIK